MWRREESVRDAFQDLAEAETLNKASDIRRGADSTNPKIEAVIRLNYCHGYMLKGDLDQARREMQAWKLLEKQVEHVYVRQLAGRRDAEIDKLDSDFTILGPLSEANSDQLEKALKGFLARQIDRTCPGRTDREKADRLQIHENTLKTWRTYRDTLVEVLRAPAQSSKLATSSK